MDDKKIAGDVTTVVFRKDMKVMKRIVITLTTMTIALLLLGTTSITVQAYDWQEHYEKMRAKREQQEKEFTEKWLDELEADGNLTQAAIDAAGEYGKGRVPNHKSKSSGTETSSSTTSPSYSGAGKGWVYSCDELHVIGLPEGENGYTLPGWYGDID